MNSYLHSGNRRGSVHRKPQTKKKNKGKVSTCSTYSLTTKTKGSGTFSASTGKLEATLRGETGGE